MVSGSNEPPPPPPPPTEFLIKFTFIEYMLYLVTFSDCDLIIHTLNL